MGVGGAGRLGRAFSRILFAMIQLPRPPPCLGSTAGSPGFCWGSCSPHTSLPTLSLGQDELELELVLKGSYEDTQTSALGTASAFHFHYMAAQEAELSGRLRVGLWVSSLELSCQPQDWVNSSCCTPLPGLPPAKTRPLWHCRPPLVRHHALVRQSGSPGPGMGMGELLYHVCLWALQWLLQ